MNTELKWVKEKLSKSKLSGLGRAADMVWMQFVNAKATGDEWLYALHIQCPWRILKQNKILVGSRDIYEALPGVKYEEWDTIGNNYFDKIVNEQLTPQFPLEIKCIEIDSLGGIKISFLEEYDFEIFIDTDNLIESWRFICKDKDHIVFREI